jgi:hypothetical protein
MSYIAVVYFCRINSCLLHRNGPIVSKLEFDKKGFIMKVVYDFSSLPRDR